MAGELDSTNANTHAHRHCHGNTHRDAHGNGDFHRNHDGDSNSHLNCDRHRLIIRNTHEDGCKVNARGNPRRTS